MQSISLDFRRSLELVAPVELVERPGISFPVLEIGIRPMTATAAGQVHAIELKACLGGGTGDSGRLTATVVQSLQSCLADITNAQRWGFTPIDLKLDHL